MVEISRLERVEIVEKMEREYLPTKFNFLKAHGGLRPGMIHGLFSDSGSGKSTLVRSILNEAATHGKVLLWLSEETLEDFKYQAIKSNMNNTLLRNICVFTEQDYPDASKLGPKGVIQLIRQKVADHKADVMFYDNLTTSVGYMDKTPQEQSEFAWDLKSIASESQCMMFLVAHTGKTVNSVNQGLICGDDVRGSKSIKNLTPYLYIFQRLIVGTESFPFIRIEKNRTHNTPDRLYGLTYDDKNNMYSSDIKLEFDRLKEVYEQRNRL